eukprot:scaffold59410_cov66-Attheya_sp.AAC.8
MTDVTQLERYNRAQSKSIANIRYLYDGLFDTKAKDASKTISEDDKSKNTGSNNDGQHDKENNYVVDDDIHENTDPAPYDNKDDMNAITGPNQNVSKKVLQQVTNFELKTDKNENTKLARTSCAKRKNQGDTVVLLCPVCVT